MLGDVNKLFVFKSLLTTPSNVLPLHLKLTFPPIIWISTEGKDDGIKSRIPFNFFSTLAHIIIANTDFLKGKKCILLIYLIVQQDFNLKADDTSIPDNYATTWNSGHKGIALMLYHDCDTHSSMTTLLTHCCTFYQAFLYAQNQQLAP